MGRKVNTMVKLPQCRYCHTFGHFTADCPEHPVTDHVVVVRGADGETYTEARITFTEVIELALFFGVLSADAAVEYEPSPF